ncbi:MULTISPECIES: hypothetical protein [unclassified Dysgonomonas]|uniref:hypothetical protein n=1 Tax=unclassified Dysgonomonas TaxID=2630389 RepID=UPI0013D4B9B2|nr:MULTISPECIES: hypothetical protein [unclassified Dysgonomonas]NDV80137.1 hypothetical protein [Dysgonomonas sp. 511]NDW08425.1 hypothetical protein [Dysgonomonas sp. 520]
MIEIQDIQTNNIDDIINRLLDEKEQPFEIYVPKSTQTFSSSNRDIANDYAMLAFVGQKLDEVADDFTYYYVSPSAHDSVLFEVKTNNIKQLAETILNISYGYGNDSEEDEIYFLDDVYDFIEKVITGEVVSVCPDFIEDYQEYNEYADESEGSDE